MPNVGPGRSVIAFDVGGTDIKSALIDERGEVRGFGRSATPVERLNPLTPGANGNLGAAPQIIAQLRELQLELTRAHPDVTPVAASIVVPGIVDSDRGVGVFASNLGWKDAPIRALAEQALGIPVAFHHDIHSASSAELKFGSARNVRNAVVVVLGTGIAGTVIIDGAPYLAGGFAGEIGHSPVADGPQCPCGGRGCLETIASGGAIARRYRDRVLASGDGRATPDRVRDILTLADAGDVDARAVWEEALDALALAFAQITAVIAPDAIVLAGGLSLAGDALVRPLRERLEARLSFHRRPEILTAQLGGDAGLIGAVLFARALAEANEAAANAAAGTPFSSDEA
nr:ROK family protein [Leucobacter exalbidus]